MAYTTPPTFVSGNTLTAAELNTYLRDNFKALADPWTAYTPTLTNWTLGNGTLTGRWSSVGALVHYSITFTLGSTTTTAGNLIISLPANSVLPLAAPLGIAALTDTSASSFQKGWVHTTGALANTVNVLTDASGRVNATTPFTWANGDQIIVNGSYEAAV